MCQGPLRLLPIRFACFCGSDALSQLPSPRAYSLEVVLWYTDLLMRYLSRTGGLLGATSVTTGLVRALFQPWIVERGTPICRASVA